MLEELKKYSHRDWSVVIIIAELSSTMKEQDVTELTVDIPMSGDKTVAIKIKR
jgi:hypothetical protein